jgi:hypothetical protein
MFVFSADDEPQRTTKSNSKMVNGNVGDEEPTVRRSTRHRRLLYDTFNTSLIDRIQSANSAFENGTFRCSAGRVKPDKSEGNTVLTNRRRRNQEVDLNDLPPDEV